MNNVAEHAREQKAGMKCPQCGAFIETSIFELLTSNALQCPSCHLRLNIDRMKSKAAFDALRKVQNAQEKLLCAAIRLRICATVFKRMGEKIRHPFRKEIPKTIPVVETAPQPVADNATEATVEESSVIRSADQCGEQARYFLLRNNKPVGKPFSYYHPEIRIVHVGSFVNAFLFFLRMCDQRLLTYRQTGEYLHCTAVFPDESGNLYFTNKVTCRNKENTVAVLKIDYVGLKPKITEIRFELNIKK